MISCVACDISPHTRHNRRMDIDYMHMYLTRTRHHYDITTRHRYRTSPHDIRRSSLSRNHTRWLHACTLRLPSQPLVQIDPLFPCTRRCICEKRARLRCAPTATQRPNATRESGTVSSKIRPPRQPPSVATAHVTSTAV